MIDAIQDRKANGVTDIENDEDLKQTFATLTN